MCVGLTGVVRHVGFLSHRKLWIRVSLIQSWRQRLMPRGGSDFSYSSLRHLFSAALPLPQWGTGISWRLANRKTTSCFLFPYVAIHFQRWYLNWTKGQPRQTEQLISASQSRVGIDTKKWNFHFYKCTNDKMMPASTIQILINLNMWVNGREENISCGDKLTKRLTANKMDVKMGNHSFYYSFFLKFTLYDLPALSLFSNHILNFPQKSLSIHAI